MDILNKESLNILGFSDKGKCPFKPFEQMHYWVKNGVCLFYNSRKETPFDTSFLVGYAMMNAGKYYAVSFRWIDKVDELKTIYESITNESIYDPI